MPDLFTDEYENAKAKWEKAREKYDDATRLHEATTLLLKHQFKELEITTREFQIQQALAIKSARNFSSNNIKSIKKG
jgi:hypothetical protein